MFIESRGGTPINGIQLRAGRHNYKAIDHKDPLTALQLVALKEIGAIDFDELVDAKPAMEALDDPEQELIIDVERKTGFTKLQRARNIPSGRKAPLVVERVYKGSKIVKPEVEAKSDVGKADKPTSGTGKDNNTAKSSGRVSGKSKD